MHIRSVGVFAVTLAIVQSLWAEPSSLEEVIADVQAKQQQIETYSADLDMQMSAKGATNRMDGTIQGKGALSSTVMNMNAGGQNMSMKTIFDAAGVTWTEMNMMGMKQVMKSSAAGSQGLGGMFGGPGSNPDDMFDGMQEDYELEFSGRENLDGVDVYVLTGKIRPEARKDMDRDEASMMDSAKMYIGVSDGFPRRVQMFSKDGKPTLTQNWKNVTINGPMADSLFAYTPPPGVRVMEMGQMPGFGAGGFPQN